jgi:phospholipid transport system substrate-binding protein
MVIRNLLSSVLLVLMAGAARCEDIAPQQVVEQTVQRLAAQLDSRREQLSANRKELYALVDGELLPQFDTDYAGRLVLGKSWRNATPEQRKRFVDVFYNFLLRSYATAILKFDQKNVRILPARKQPEGDRAIVDTEMRMSDGRVIPVSYAMHNTPAGWKAYDVRIEGISYVQNYRNQFNAEVAARGLDALIARLEKETADIDAGRREPAPPSRESGSS